jgi:hypothetical protein
MAVRVRRDSKGIAAMLQSGEVAARINALGASVAGNISETADGEPVPVEVRSRIASGGKLSPRPASDVVLAHPAGLRIEAKRGTLVRAASAAGLEVKRRPF